jgi:hypothetical protein
MNKIELNKYSSDYSKKVAFWVAANIYSDFTLTTKFDWSNKRVASRGGLYATGPGINIAMASAYPNNNGEVYRFYEYKSYDSDNTIGGFYAKDPILKLEALLLHEIAHAVQFFSYKKTGTRCKPHGPVFKNYYRILRTEFLNEKLPEQRVLRDEYEEYINKLNRGVEYVIKDLLARAASPK